MLKRLTYLILFSLLLLKGVSATFPSTSVYAHKNHFGAAFHHSQNFFSNPDPKSVETEDLFIEEREEEETENTKRTFPAYLADWISTIGVPFSVTNPTSYINEQTQGFTLTANHIFIKVIRV